jgi:hypothetical protein
MGWLIAIGIFISMFFLKDSASVGDMLISVGLCAIAGAIGEVGLAIRTRK